MPKQSFPAATEGMPIFDPSQPKGAAFERFVAAVMQPRPPAEMIDTRENADMRASRRPGWQKAALTLSYRKAQFHLACCELSYRTHVLDETMTSYARWAALEVYRAAIVELIFTPAVQQSGVVMKQRLLREPGLPADYAALRAAIDADLTFLAAHPVKRGQS